MFTRRTSLHVLRDILALNIVTKGELATLANLSHRLANDYISFLEKHDLMERKIADGVTCWQITAKGTEALFKLTDTMEVLGIDTLAMSRQVGDFSVIWGQVKDAIQKARMNIIDLSASISNRGREVAPVQIRYHNHRDTARIAAENFGLEMSAFPGGIHVASETIVLGSHVGTHMDAPLHFGDKCEGKPAKTIDEIPLEWCFGDGVVLDFTKKRAGEVISAKEVQGALQMIGYVVKPLDIVLIRTDSSKHFDDPASKDMHPGVSKEATLWLIEQGVKVMGIDAFHWNLSFAVTAAECRHGGEDRFADRYLGRQREYCHIEKLANLDKIPHPYGFKVAVFPVKIEKASGAWVRAVAMVRS